MSETIQATRQRNWRAALVRQPPSALIDDVEPRDEFANAYRSAKIYSSGRHLIDVGVIGAGGVGQAFSTNLTRSVFLVGAYPTSGQVVVQSEFGPDKWVEWAEVSKNELLKLLDTAARSSATAAARLRVDRLTAIQAAFGLPNQAFAEVLGISRQGLYNWLDASEHIKLQAASLQRLASVERLAKLWREHSNAPLSSVAREPLPGGRTVLDMLTDESLNEAAVVGAFDELVAKLHGQPKSLSQKMNEAGFTRRPSMRPLPADE